MSGLNFRCALIDNIKYETSYGFYKKQNLKMSSAANLEVTFGVILRPSFRLLALLNTRSWAFKEGLFRICDKYENIMYWLKCSIESISKLLFYTDLSDKFTGHQFYTNGHDDEKMVRFS